MVYINDCADVCVCVFFLFFFFVHGQLCYFGLDIICLRFFGTYFKVDTLMGIKLSFALLVLGGQFMYNDKKDTIKTQFLQ